MDRRSFLKTVGVAMVSLSVLREQPIMAASVPVVIPEKKPTRYHGTKATVYTTDQWWCALFSDVWGVENGNSELVGNGYKRVPLQDDVVFSDATGDWAIEAVGLYDAPIGGHLLWWYDLPYKEGLRVFRGDHIAMHCSGMFGPDGMVWG